jgi:ferric-dicitrate binding protein FerR (iron transport regulator)
MKNNIQEIIVRVLKNEVLEEEMRFFSEWLDSSDENKNLFFELKRVYDYRKEGGYPDDSEMEASWERLLKKIQGKNSPLRRRNTSLRRKKLSITRWRVAATITGLLILGATLFYAQRELPVTWVEIQNPARGNPLSISLPDGSAVQLNASSYLKYPKKFKRRGREIYLDGEALFDVVKQNGNDFVVHSNKHTIRVLGTKFNVMDYSSDAYSVTTLISGKVQLETFNEKKNLRDRVVMNPEQQLRFDATTGQITLNQVDIRETTSWINGVYSFQDVPLQQITDRLNKIYGVTIIIENEKSRTEKYTGKFSSKQDIEEIMRIINFNGQFNCITRNDTIILQQK